MAERVETGPVRIGEDWAGVFIRGDSALYHALALDNVIQRTPETSDIFEDDMARANLVTLRHLLYSCLEPCEATPLRRAGSPTHDEGGEG